MNVLALFQPLFLAPQDVPEDLQLLLGDVLGGQPRELRLDNPPDLYRLPDLPLLVRYRLDQGGRLEVHGPGPESALTDLALHQAVGFQDRQGFPDGNPVDVEGLGQFAFRRELLPGDHVAIQEEFLKLDQNFLVDALPLDFLELHCLILRRLAGG